MASGHNLKLKGKIEEFYKDLIPVLQRFPKTQRYTLAENIEKETLKSIRCVLEAEYTREKRLSSLKELRITLHLILFLLRVSYESSFFKEGTYEKLSQELIEMGKITSGWIKREEVT